MTGGELAAGFTTVYLVAFVLLLAVEIVAIVDDTPGNTISEHFWSVRTSPLVWAAIPAVTWAFGHLVFPFEPDGRLWNDFLYLVVGAGFALWNVNHRRPKP